MKPVLFFDLDGTLTDSAPGIFAAIRYAQRQARLRALDEAELRSCVGPPLNESFIRLWGVGREEAEHLLEVYRIYYRATGIFENAPYPGIRETLEALSEKADLRVCSAKPTEMIRTVLTHFDLSRFFSSVSGAALHGTFPGKGVFLRASREPGRPALMIGDRQDDMTGARDAGIPGAGVLWGYGSREELLKSGAAYLVKRPDELPKLVDTLFH